MRLFGWTLMCIGGCALWCAATFGQVRPLISDAGGEVLQKQLQSLDQSLQILTNQGARHVPDAQIFHKGLAWALAYDREFAPAHLALVQKAVNRGQQRVALLIDGKMPWLSRRGKLVLGYRSSVDGSVQPYGLIIPKNYDPALPIRLDVVLHGSTRPVGMSELRFMARFDEGDDETASPTDQAFIEVHPLGRVENCYRWAGETDVFEVIDDVCSRYTIDRQRIVLRGMSMGASGTWHLGLKHPDRFAALGPYCGYVDTHQFSETPLANFVKIGQLPQYQELGLHMLDSVDYAANAATVPVVACMGEKDVFFQAHVLMGEAMRREGLTLVNLISPGTGHVIDPKTQAEQMRRISEIVRSKTADPPNELRFVTWTLKYSHCHWLDILKLERHYARAELRAQVQDDVIAVEEPVNISQFAIRTSQLQKLPAELRIGDQKVEVPHAMAIASPGVVLAREQNRWKVAGALGTAQLTGKRPGLQGPIDDAFTKAFLCVRGTGQPWNAAASTYADRALKRFAAEWRHYFRGDLPLKLDTELTDEDIRSRNLILFGDPGSNQWIAKVLPQLPLSWTKETLQLNGREYSSSHHVPALITANPLPGGKDHYLVLNSGHTFREAELATLNYLLFPRWGDWAVLQIDPRAGVTAPAQEEVVVSAGYFDEEWR